VSHSVTHLRSWSLVNELNSFAFCVLNDPRIARMLGEQTVNDKRYLVEEVQKLLTENWNKDNLLVKGDGDGE
jgi:hypothetical protein